MSDLISRILGSIYGKNGKMVFRKIPDAIQKATTKNNSDEPSS